MTFTFTGLDKYTPVAAQVNNANKSIGDSTQRMADRSKSAISQLAGAYNALIVAKHAARAVGTLLGPAVDMQQAMANLEAATGASGDAIDKFKAAANEAAGITPFTPVEAVQALQGLNLAIRDTKAASESLIPTLSFAHTFMKGDVAGSTKLLSRLVKGFGISAEEAAGKLDKLVAIQRVTGVQAADLAEGFKKLGVVSGISKSNFEDIAPVFALVTRGFDSASATTTGLIRGVQRLANPEVAGRLREQFGIIVSSEGGFKSMQRVMIDLANAAKLNANNWPAFVAQVTQVFGARAAKTFISGVQQLNKGFKGMGTGVLRGADAFKVINEAMAKSGGLLHQITQDVMKTTQGQLLLLNDAWIKVRGSMFDAAVAGLGPLVTHLLHAVDAVTYLFTELGPLSWILRGLVRVLVIGGGILGAFYAAKLVWIGVTAIASNAIGMLRNQVLLTNGAMAGTITSAKSAVVGYVALIRSAGIARGTLQALGLTAKAMWRSVLGPIGLIWLLVDGLSWLYKGAKKLLGISSDTAKSDTKKLQSAAAKHKQAIMDQMRVTSKLGNTISGFEGAVKNWKQVIQSKLPMLPHKALQFFSKEVEKLISSGAVNAKGAALMRERVADVRQVFTARDAATPEEVKKSQNAITFLGELTKATSHDTKKAAEATKMAATEVDRFRTKSDRMARTLIALGIGTDGFKKALDKQLVVSTKQVYKTEEELRARIALAEHGHIGIGADMKSNKELQRSYAKNRELALASAKALDKQTLAQSNLQKSTDMVRKTEAGGYGALLDTYARKELKQSQIDAKLRKAGPALVKPGGATTKPGKGGAGGKSGNELSSMAADTQTHVALTKQLLKVNKAVAERLRNVLGTGSSDDGSGLRGPAADALSSELMELATRDR